MNASCGLLVNASRSILYASDGKDFATAARTECLRLGDEMNRLLQQYT
jgi:orotidine-5'-phosphate decarboxylase